jgi:hypothetical protein
MLKSGGIATRLLVQIATHQIAERVAGLNPIDPFRGCRIFA